MIGSRLPAEAWMALATDILKSQTVVPWTTMHPQFERRQTPLRTATQAKSVPF